MRQTCLWGLLAVPQTLAFTAFSLRRSLLHHKYQIYLSRLPFSTPRKEFLSISLLTTDREPPLQLTYATNIVARLDCCFSFWLATYHICLVEEWSSTISPVCPSCWTNGMLAYGMKDLLAGYSLLPSVLVYKLITRCFSNIHLPLVYWAGVSITVSFIQLPEEVLMFSSS